MSAAQDYLTEFHKFFDLDVDAQVTEKPTILVGKDLELRKNLITEEYHELMEALDNAALSVENPADDHSQEEALTHVYKELADLVYVCYGLDVKIGSRLDDVLEIVHQNNLSKVWPDGKVHRRPSDGKILKPEGFMPPDISLALTDYLRQDELPF